MKWKILFANVFVNALATRSADFNMAGEIRVIAHYDVVTASSVEYPSISTASVKVIS
jgi:hypothetical protein